MTEEPREETATRGGYALPPPPASGEFVGPADDPDRYELMGAGISGGEGTTWRARYHGRLHSPLPLAVKQLRPPPGAAPGWPSEEERRRWQDQAALLRHVRSEHVVALYEVFAGPPPHSAGKDTSDDQQAAYLVMEWVEGLTLSQLCRDKPVGRESVGDRTRWVAQAAAALHDLASATRSAGNPSLHRDIKPSNCIVNDSRGVVLIDVSTLRLVDDGFDAAGFHTPQYTAPEAREAPHRPRTVATEVYALGALAAFCLTGKDPAPGGDLRTELTTVARQAEVTDPDALAGHVLAALETDPRRRPADPDEWSRRLCDLGRVPSRWPIYLTAALSMVLLAGLFIAVEQPWRPGARPSAAPPSSAPLVTGRTSGTITTPVGGGSVKQCAYFTGTASVPPGYTLVLAMRNLVNGDPERYAEVVFGWDDPARLSDWRGAQYFGNDDETVGQRYRVELVAVTVDAARAWRDSDDATGNDMVAAGTVLDQVDVRRVAGSEANACVGP
ncbi:protein kinase [Actinoplanes sp. NPDC023936]|uniref:serine/threonine protein kinase n=1 Tax=Actinoplanes sp. NPDC023936 TaxID=3154910 RepID=UPI003410A01B